jgi:prepilin-type N-terminal cleavage/methylation domain-containing protein
VSAARGFSLVELAVVLAVLAIGLAVAAPAVDRIATGIELRLAADEVVVALRQARGFALRHGGNVGIKFRTDDEGAVEFALYADGDEDGVRTNDIESGRDPIVAAPRRLGHFGRRIRFGFPSGEPPRDPGDPRRKLDRLDDPIRFNRSDIASFSALEGATPGSIYLTDGRGLLCVRVNNRSSRTRVLVYEPEARRWRE